MLHPVNHSCEKGQGETDGSIVDNDDDTERGSIIYSRKVGWSHPPDQTLSGVPLGPSQGSA